MQSDGAGGRAFDWLVVGGSIRSIKFGSVRFDSDERLKIFVGRANRRQFGIYIYIYIYIGLFKSKSKSKSICWLHMGCTQE